ncbi:MAG TPA: DNA-binding response regulator, partial [Lachnospiraceae bacterium]|nr:DNA-binding response regulator [Lachnospiraceae bacterium]
MIRMIIADDEPMIIRGIQNLLDWKKLGIEIVGTYSDGEAVLDGILSLKPDIALLDIAMPGKTGIEILKEMKKLGSTTGVIFISGYQNFSYAQDAVKYGAADYILKPILEAELESAL